ncbi:hypothetical protein ACFVYT_24850 [Streptomyces sp. NPDC058290]|uniref:hypothetical protein n=1 Tax=Streptomyces sp. NPDC058290 TaxID=3346426 RepID=UPI0036EEB80D
MNATPQTAEIEMPADADLAWAEREQKRRHRDKVDSAAARIAARFDIDAYLQTQDDEYPVAA